MSRGSLCAVSGRREGFLVLASGLEYIFFNLKLREENTTRNTTKQKFSGHALLQLTKTKYKEQSVN
jgi:hypothetical protein